MRSPLCGLGGANTVSKIRVCFYPIIFGKKADQFFLSIFEYFIMDIKIRIFPNCFDKCCNLFEDSNPSGFRHVTWNKKLLIKILLRRRLGISSRSLHSLANIRTHPTNWRKSSAETQTANCIYITRSFLLRHFANAMFL